MKLHVYLHLCLAVLTCKIKYTESQLDFGDDPPRGRHGIISNAVGDVSSSVQNGSPPAVGGPPVNGPPPSRAANSPISPPSSRLPPGYPPLPPPRTDLPKSPTRSPIPSRRQSSLPQSQAGAQPPRGPLPPRSPSRPALPPRRQSVPQSPAALPPRRPPVPQSPVQPQSPTIPQSPVPPRPNLPASASIPQSPTRQPFPQSPGMQNIPQSPARPPITTRSQQSPLPRATPIGSRYPTLSQPIIPNPTAGAAGHIPNSSPFIRHPMQVPVDHAGFGGLGGSRMPHGHGGYYRPIHNEYPMHSEEICHLHSDPGHCNLMIGRWYYDHRYHRCLPFLYTGCGGNHNNFHSFEQCEGATKRCEFENYNYPHFRNPFLQHAVTSPYQFMNPLSSLTPNYVLAG